MEALVYCTDNQLIEILDKPGLWFVRGGRMGILGVQCESLRKAALQAFDFSMKGESPGPLVRMPSDDIVVPAEQIYSLWKALGLAVAA
jgi:hypothetical protein